MQPQDLGLPGGPERGRRHVIRDRRAGPVRPGHRAGGADRRRRPRAGAGGAATPDAGEHDGRDPPASTGDRQVMLLYLEDEDAATIAEVTGLSPPAVATRIHRIQDPPGPALQRKEIAMTGARGHDGSDWIMLWKGQAMTADAPTIENRIRHRAERLDSVARRRNRQRVRAGGAAALVLGAAGAAQLIAATGPADLLRAVGFLWLVGAAVVSAVVLRKHGGCDRAGDLTQDSLSYLRTRLRHERGSAAAPPGGGTSCPRCLGSHGLRLRGKALRPEPPLGVRAASPAG